MFIIFDTETHLIKPGMIMPRLVCVSWAIGEKFGLFDREHGLAKMKEWLSDSSNEFLGHHVQFDWGVLAAEDITLLPLIFKAYEEGRIHDTKIRQQLVDIAHGNLKFHEAEEGEEETEEGSQIQHILKTQYSLEALAWRLCKIKIEKKDTWRLRYTFLDGVALESWPQDAIDYAIGDARVTQKVYQEQKDRYMTRVLVNSKKQHQAAWALHLMSAWGVRTDEEAVVKLKAHLTEELRIAYSKLADANLLKADSTQRNMEAIRKKVLLGYLNKNGLLSRDSTFDEVVKAVSEEKLEKVRKDLATISGKEDDSKSENEKLVELMINKNGVEVAALIFDMAKANFKLPVTPKGSISTASDTLKTSGDVDLLVLAEAMKNMKLMNTYVPILESGTRQPINASFNVLVETGRTSCSRPNLQNPPRKGGVRDSFIPRPHHVFVAVDYDTLELRTLAQATIAFGCKERHMAAALCRGEDLHLSLAADLLGVDREEAKNRYAAGDKEMDEHRQLCKIANFGYPGGMAAKTFVDYAYGYGVTISLEKATELHEAWKKAWAEMAEYFANVKEQIKIDDPINGVSTIKHFYSHRFRGDVTFTAAANSYFQGLAADGAKDALWHVTKEALTDTSSPLFGSHPVIFLHDEVITEVPFDPIHPEKASNAAKRQAEIMINVMKKWVEDIPISATPVMFKRWYKGAKPVYDTNKNLLPSKPVTEGNKIRWEADL